jgi:hypothetical protein
MGPPDMYSFLTRAAIGAALTLAPGAALACACGCDLFDVGGPDMTAGAHGGVVSLEYDFMDQDQNWSGASKAPAADNEDKQIATRFVTSGVQYMFSRDWGVIAQVPVWSRTFRTADAGPVETFHATGIGDVRLEAVYTGLSPDMSTGLILGLSLPTGDWKHAGFDRDTQIGGGSTNILVGGYHQGALGGTASPWGYFLRGLYDAPVATQGGYRAGQEFAASAGISYRAASFAGGKVRLTPLLQVLVSARGRDTGPEADPGNTGYERVVLAPGVAFDLGAWRLYGDVEVPVHQRVNGDQLVARTLFKVAVSRRF